MDVRIPSDLLKKEQFSALSPNEKERYTSKVIKRILELNPNGITLSQIADNTYFTKATIWRHLEKLVTTREAYKLEFGRVSVYYSNGKLIHPLFSEDLKVGGKTYPILFVRNNLGDFIYLQEKQEDKLGRSEVCGGIIIPLDAVETLAQRLLKIKEKVKEVFKNEKNRS